jgi:hypothetical protein
MAKFCQECGSKINDEKSVFCKNCEMKLNAELPKKPSINSFTQPKDEGQIPKNNSTGEIITKAIFYYVLIGGVAVVVCIIFAAIMSATGAWPNQLTTSPAMPITPTDPNAFRTAVPTPPTPLPTPTTKIGPKFSRGDILTFKPVTKDDQILYIILNYDSVKDGYDATFIHRNDDGSWGHWYYRSVDMYFSRTDMEAHGIYVYGHIDPDQVHCEELKDPDAAEFFPCARN